MFIIINVTSSIVVKELLSKLTNDVLTTSTQVITALQVFGRWSQTKFKKFFCFARIFLGTLRF